MFGTPQAADQFSRFMVGLYDDRDNMPAPGGFCTFFGRQETGAEIIFSDNSEVVDIDIIRGNEKIAAMIPRGLNGRTLSGQKNTQNGNSTNISRAFPLSEEEGDITASQLNKALAGEGRYNSGETPFSRMRNLGFKIYTEQMRRQARLFEVLAASSIITGQQPAILGTTNPDLLYDFRRDSGNFITVGTAWSNVASNILGDLDAACFKVRQKGRLNPDMAVLSSTDIDSLIKNTAVKDLADNRRFELIDVSTNNPVPPKFMEFVAAGFIPRGRLKTPKGFELWLFTYIDTYEDDAGTPTFYLPNNKTIVCSSKARCDAYFGPREVMPIGSAKAQWFREMFGFNLEAAPLPQNLMNSKWSSILPRAVSVDAYPREGDKGIAIRTQAGPIFATTQTDAFVTITTTP